VIPTRAEPNRYIGTMAMNRNATLTTTDAFIEISIRVRQALRETETATRRFQRRVEAGSSVTDAFSVLGEPGRFTALTDLLSALEHARRDCRRAVAAQAKAEGMSQRELARMWGVSRQLVTRIAKGTST
jgi:ribosome-binding protein aMBF1 (putative translation factor)